MKTIFNSMGSKSTRHHDCALNLAHAHWGSDWCIQNWSREHRACTCTSFSSLHTWSYRVLHWPAPERTSPSPNCPLKISMTLHRRRRLVVRVAALVLLFSLGILWNMKSGSLRVKKGRFLFLSCRVKCVNFSLPFGLLLTINATFLKPIKVGTWLGHIKNLPVTYSHWQSSSWHYTHSWESPRP